MMIHICADVVLKYTIGAPVPATLEMVSYYYMSAAVFLPFAALERDGNLVFVEIIYDRIGADAQTIFHLLALVFSVAYCGVLAYAAWNPAVRAFAAGSYAGTLTQIPIWPTRFLPIVGFSLLAVVMLAKIFVILTGGTIVSGSGDVERDLS